MNESKVRWRWWYVLPTLVWIPMSVRAFRGMDHNDYSIFREAAQQLADGLPLYEGAYMYPPLMAWLLVPLTWLPELVAGTVWNLLKIPLFYWSAHVFTPRELSPRARRTLLVLAPVLVFRFLESDMANGNCNVYLLAGVALCFRWCQAGRPVWAAWAGAAVASVKLSPLYLCVPYFMNSRRLCAVLVAVFAVVLVVGSSVPLDGGIVTAWRGFTGTSAAVFEPPVTEIDDPQRGYLPGQSLRPMLHRWLTDSDATAHDQARVTINVLTLDRETVEWIYRVLALTVAIAGVFMTRQRGLQWALATSLCLLLLISPYSRKAHFLWLLPSVFMVLGVLGTPSRRRVLLWGLFLAYFFCGHLTARHIVGREWSYLINGAGATFLSAVAILMAMWIIRPREAVLGSDSESGRAQ